MQGGVKGNLYLMSSLLDSLVSSLVLHVLGYHVKEESFICMLLVLEKFHVCLRDHSILHSFRGELAWQF